MVNYILRSIEKNERCIDAVSKAVRRNSKSVNRLSLDILIIGGIAVFAYVKTCRQQNEIDALSFKVRELERSDNE